MEQTKKELRRIKHKIISMGNPTRGAKNLFANESPDTLLKYFDFLCKDSFLCKGLVGRFSASEISQIEHCGTMPRFHNVQQTLGWYTLALCAQSKQINKFLEIKDRFDHTFLLGNYDQCTDLLQFINTEFGHTLWGLKKIIAIIREQKDNDYQKQYADTLWKEMEQGSVSAYQIYCYSRQCEHTISVGAYYNMIKSDYDRFLRKGVSGTFCKYAFFKVSDCMDFPNEKNEPIDTQIVNDFLFLDDKYGIIDRYISLCAILSNIFLGDNSNLQRLFIPYISKLSEYIKDPFLRNISYQWEHHFYPFYACNNDSICNIFDLYSMGQYEDSNILAGTFLRENIKYFPLIELYSKSCIHLPNFITLTDNPSLLNTIAKKLNQLFARTGNTKDILLDLAQILYKHTDAAWTHELNIIIDKYNSKLMILEECSFKNLHSSISTPDLIFDFDSVFLSTFLERTTETYRSSVSTLLSIAVRTKNLELLNSLNLDSNRKKRYIASLLAETQSYEALYILDQIKESCLNSAIRLEVDAIRIRAYLHLGELLKAIEIFVPTFCENSNFIYMGYIDRIFDEIKSGNHDVSASILTPIICSLYFNYYPEHRDMDDIVLCVCYDEYLESCGVAKPSSLLDQRPADTNLDMYVRFLAEVCVPSVMERSLAFESEDDILRERNIICSALSDLDPSNREKYNDELRRHTNTLLVRLAKREIENGKIYVDIESIRSLLVQEICEPVERYLQVTKDNQLIAVLNNRLGAFSDPICFYSIGPAGKTEILEEIVKKVRDIFTADNKYGLDGTLSVRIRHGTLESQLRSCFEKHKLVTTKGIDGRYNSNNYWNTGKNTKRGEIKDIDDIFSSFSAKIDTQIAYLKNKLIQIRTESKNSEGFFDFSIDTNLIARIEADMYQVKSYEQFETYIIELMLDITEDCLSVVREKLHREINDFFQQTLIDLEKDLQCFARTFNFQGLRDQIANARTDISVELKNISEWFRYSQSDDFMDYDLSLAAQLSYQTYQHAHPACSLNCTYEQIDKSIILEGHTLRSVVDILIILLDNVVKHSGFAVNPSATISAKKDREFIVISVENPIYNSSINSQINEIREQLDTWEERDIIRREGGSGLYKIKKILSVDLGCHNQITPYCQDDVFLIEIRAELGGAVH